jgi:hypothetical protein
VRAHLEKDVLSALVELEFGELADAWSFLRTYASDRQVDYVSRTVHIRFTWDVGRSFELDVTFQLVEDSNDQRRPSYSLLDFLTMAGVEDARRIAWVTITRSDMLAGAVHKMVAAIECHGRGLLTGNALVYSRLQQWCYARAKDHHDATTLERARESALEAWRKRDFRKVISVLSVLRSNQLTAVDQKRLKIARRLVTNDEGPAAT